MRRTSQCVRKWRPKPLAEVLLLFSCDCKKVTSPTSAQFSEKRVRIPKRKKNSGRKRRGKSEKRGQGQRKKERKRRRWRWGKRERETWRKGGQGKWST